MDCEQMLQLIHHYMDGGLSQWRHRAVTRHIDACPPCAHEHHTNVQVRRVVAMKCTEEAPNELRMRIFVALGTCQQEPGPLDISTKSDFRQ